MNEEEFKALQAEKEALLNKNRELLSELRTAKNKNKEIDPENYSKVLDENDALKSELNKIKNDLGLKTKDIEQLTGKLTEKENYLKNLTLENSLNEQLTKVGVKAELLPAVKALLKGQASVNDNNVLIGDKAINDFMTEWSATDGKAYIQAPANSGTGATGSNGNMSASTPKRSEMNHQQKGEYIKANGQEAYLNLPN